MPVSNPHPIRLKNQKGSSDNPRESEFFYFDHYCVPSSGTCIVSYSLSGDVPKNISVNSSGVISGKIEWFGDQPSCQNNKPHEKPELDGRNWDKNGRFKELSYLFKFNIICYHKDPSGSSSCVVSTSTSFPCEILLVKDHDIDNKIWLDEYNYPLGDKANPKPERKP